MLIDVPGLGYIYREVLHDAVSRPCQPIVVELLLRKGAQVVTLNAYGDTALEVAIKNCQTLDVIKLLLKGGSPINTRGSSISKPLMLSVEDGRINPELVETLLLAGARIGIMEIRRRHPLFEVVIDQHSSIDYEAGIECLKLLVKFYLLEFKEFNVKDLVQNDRIINDALKGFVVECKVELHQMRLKNVGHGHTLHQLVSSTPLPHRAVYCKIDRKYFDMNQLMEAISDNAFPVYFDVISINVGRELM